jgi:hypothetical protein
MSVRTTFDIDIATGAVTRSLDNTVVAATATFFSRDILPIEVRYNLNNVDKTADVLTAGAVQRIGFRRYTGVGAALALADTYEMVGGAAQTTLNLNTAEMFAYMDALSNDQTEKSAYLEFEVTSADGLSRVTYAQTKATIKCEVVIEGDVPPEGGGATSGVADGFNAQAWDAGSLSVTADANAKKHLEVITVGLAAGAALLTVDDETSISRAPNNRLDIMFRLPVTVGIIITIQNTTGDTLYSIETDASGDDALFELYHDGTKWNPFRSTYPVNFGM